MGVSGRYENVNAELPILLVSGVDDPCAGGNKGRVASKSVLENAGFKNLEVITYDHMRHEILNENKKDKVYQDILNFLNK